MAAGALSIGVRPTIEGAVGRTVEVYLLDFDGDLYGKTLRLHRAARLREERRYPSLDELKVQIARDVDEARAITAPIVAALAVGGGGGGAFG